MKDITEREPIIEFRDFGFQYNAQAEPTLKGIDLQIRKGEKVLIAGPSGCGKSTLAHCINGLIPFAYRGTITGSVTVRGRETKDLSIFALSRTVGTVLQDSDGQFIGLTVAEDIAFALENDCVQEPELHDRVLKAAGAVGIDTHLLNAPDQLSGGQKQRVAMAGVMVDDVEVFLFDEPLANLDPATGKSAMELIDEIHDRTGAAVIIIEHRLEDVLHRNMDRIVLMNEGRIIADMDPDTLLSSELLRSHGIREPLYVTALKYAGVRVTPELKPSSIRSLRLGPEEKQKVLDWYGRTPPRPAPPPRPVLLKAEDVTFSYDGRRETLSHISLEIFRGESLAIVGTNGAGKSTIPTPV